MEAGLTNLAEPGDTVIVDPRRVLRRTDRRDGPSRGQPTCRAHAPLGQIVPLDQVEEAR